MMTLYRRPKFGDLLLSSGLFSLRCYFCKHLKLGFDYYSITSGNQLP